MNMESYEKINLLLKDAKKFLTEFVHTTYKNPILNNQVKAGKPDINSLEQDLNSGTAESWQKYADCSCFMESSKTS